MSSKGKLRYFSFKFLSLSIRSALSIWSSLENKEVSPTSFVSDWEILRSCLVHGVKESLYWMFDILFRTITSLFLQKKIVLLSPRRNLYSSMCLMISFSLILLRFSFDNSIEILFSIIISRYVLFFICLNNKGKEHKNVPMLFSFFFILSVKKLM